MRQSTNYFIKSVFAVITVGVILSGLNAFDARAITCTNTFPTSLNNYITGQCIPSAGINAIESDIGIVSSTSSSTLQGQITNLQTGYGTGIISSTAIKGNLNATTYNTTSTTSSNIQNFNNTYYVPPNFTAIGCAGSSTATTLQGCIEAISQAQIALGAPGVAIKITSSTNAWTNTINLNHNGFTVSLQCTPGVQLKYTGAANASTSLQFNFGNPTGHTVSDDYGCTYMGQSTLIAAAQTNTATTTGIYFGGNQGAVGINFHDNNVNGFGTNLEIGANAYMPNINYNAISGGNGGQASRGSLLHINTASNSGERNNFIGDSWTDPGNSSATNAIYIAQGGTASNFFSNSSFDDVQVHILGSNGQVSFMNNHWENAAYGTYHQYIPLLNESSDRSTQITFVGNLIANDTSGANSFDTIIKHGGQLYAANTNIQNYGGGTITNFVDHSNDNGVESEVICMTQAQGGTLTNIIAGGGNVTYSLANGASCWTDSANSYPIAMVANQSNTNNINSGNTTIADFNHSGLWHFYTAPGAGSGLLQSTFGDSNATFNNPVTISHKDGSSSGSLSAIGFNAYIDSQPELVTTSSPGWLIENSTQNAVTGTPLKFEYVAENSTTQTNIFQITPTSTQILNNVLVDAGGNKFVTSTAGSPSNPLTTGSVPSLSIATLASSTSLSYTGATSSFVIPSAVTSITINVNGAGGQNGSGTGGTGGSSTGTLSVTPGTTYYYGIGGSAGFGGGGTGASGGGGGGGMTWFGTQSSFSTSTAIIVAGGGGGGTGNGGSGGSGGGTTGAAGNNSTGGTQSAGGTGGNAGSAGQGGNGISLSQCSTFGGGGGGGGFFGGGSGQSSGGSGCGGAGGSGFVIGSLTNATTSQNTGAAAAANGSIKITYNVNASIVGTNYAGSIIGVATTTTSTITFNSSAFVNGESCGVEPNQVNTSTHFITYNATTSFSVTFQNALTVGQGFNYWCIGY